MRVVETTSDDPETARLLGDYFAERTAGFGPGNYRAVMPPPSMFAAPGALIRIDSDDGEALAVGGLRPIDPDGSETRMEVKHLFVAPAARGSGVGRRLLTLLEQAARNAGADLVVLDTNRSLTAAGALYRSAGYEPTAPFNENPNATDWFAKRLH